MRPASYNPASLLFRAAEPRPRKQHELAILDTSPLDPPIPVLEDMIEASHGTQVTTAARCEYPDIKIRHYPVEYSGTDLQISLKKVLADIAEGADIGAVSLSMSAMVTLEQIQELLHRPNLTMADIPSVADDIRKNWRKIPPQTGCLLFNAADVDIILERLEALTRQGVQVFISAGNAGPETFSLYALADGVTCVGALDGRGKQADYNSDNPFGVNGEADVYKSTVTTFTPVLKKDRLASLQASMQGSPATVDIPRKELKVKPRQLKNLFPFSNWLGGTSLAAPRVAAEYVRKLDASA